MNVQFLTERALKYGIVDQGYNTVRNGHVAKYKGSALVVDQDGRVYAAFGKEPQGTAEKVTKQGGIRFVLLTGTQERLMAKVIMLNEQIVSCQQAIWDLEQEHFPKIGMGDKEIPVPGYILPESSPLSEQYGDLHSRKQAALATKTKLIEEAAIHRAAAIG